MNYVGIEGRLHPYADINTYRLDKFSISDSIMDENSYLLFIKKSNIF